MCGITGIFNHSYDLANRVLAMSNTISHRGPDDGGVWADPASGVALGFRRLAILDLSPSGHQPMGSSSGRFTLVFNGEIYNHNELRKQLDAKFLGTSDTEVMLAGFEAWGVRRTVEKLNGMFAFAVWDGHEHELTLVRDRLGIKPLYYGWMGPTLLFGSELKSLKAHPDFKGDVNRDALLLYMKFGYVPDPFSIYKNVNKLPPGHLLVLRKDSPRDGAPEIYWDAREVMRSGMAAPFRGDDRQAVQMLEDHLRRSIGLRMVADVPLGALLSGGVDSSTIVALMQTQSHRAVKTYSIGFHEMGFDEAIYAKKIAQHLGTDHTELYVSQEEARSVVPLLPTLYDEPFADSSQIPTYLVSRLARNSVTVALSGDGGDELFGGYNRYLWSERIMKNARMVPSWARRAAAYGMESVRPDLWSRLAGLGIPNSADKVAKLAGILRLNNEEGVYSYLVSMWMDPSRVVLGPHEPFDSLSGSRHGFPYGTPAEQMMGMDLLTYLPGDILTKLDRASMGSSLEARSPFLDDHETVEMAWKFPLSQKIRKGTGKWILRQVLDKYVPRDMIERPKMGFGVPIDSWLRGSLREWAEDLLDEKRLRREGYLNPEPISQKWKAHLSGRSNEQSALWTALMFQSWLDGQSH